MRTINPTFKCDLDKCEYNSEPTICIESSTGNGDLPWICPHLNLYLTPNTKPAEQPCLHRQHTCQECFADHYTDWRFCKSPKKRQKQ